MRNILVYILAFAVFIFVAYGSWRIRKAWNYKFSYQNQVQMDMQPIVKRISDLEARVLILETNNINTNNFEE